MNPRDLLIASILNPCKKENTKNVFTITAASAAALPQERKQNQRKNKVPLIKSRKIGGTFCFYYLTRHPEQPKAVKDLVV